MLGLFGALNLGTRSLQTQQEGVAVAGQNLANVSNPAYARQRLAIQTSTSLPTTIGPEGTGVEATAITQLRDAFLDQQITSQTSTSGFLQSQQTALQYAEADLGEQLDSSTASSATGATAVGTSGGLANALASFFTSLQGLDPSSSASRKTMITSAQQLASRLNQVDQGLTALHDQLNQSLDSDVSKANQLMSDVATLNRQISGAESGGGATANDLRDLRQQKLESLAGLVNFKSAAQPDGSVNISVGGNLLVAGGLQQDTLQTYDAGGGQMLVRTATSAAPLTLSGGSIQGTIDVRDNALSSLQTGINGIASQLISQVNTVYRTGFAQDGVTTGADFFTGTNASDIGVNATVVNDASMLQASGATGVSDTQVAQALGSLATARQAGLGNQTFTDSYSGTVTDLGAALASVNTRISDQQAVQSMLQNQRSSVSGVSIDEEMTDLVKFQRAFQASAHLVSTIDAMLNDVVNLKQ